MNKTMMIAVATALGISANALACSLVPPPSYTVTLPKGQDGKLPVVQPDITKVLLSDDPNNSCYGVYASYLAYTGTMKGLSNDDVTKLFGPNSNIVLATPWSSAATYVGGNRVSYNGLNYTAKWWTQGDAPGAANGPWEADSSNAPAAWDAARAYTGGNQAIYGGKLYEAKWWTQGEAPGAEWGAWLLKGDAPSSIPNFTTMPGVFNVSASLADGQLTLRYSATMTTTYTYRASASCTIESSTVTTGEGTPWGIKWRVNLDGVLVNITTLPAPIHSGTLPPPPPLTRLPDGRCSAVAGTILQTNSSQMAQIANVTIPVGNARYITNWSCNNDQQSCRPSSTLDLQKMGAYGPPKMTYIPAP